jgi:hypothetical protein
LIGSRPAVDASIVSANSNLLMINAGASSQRYFFLTGNTACRSRRKNVFEPKKYPEMSCKVCGGKLKPHIEQVVCRGKYTVYDIDHWYCEDCSVMFHFEDLESITEKK